MNIIYYQTKTQFNNTGDALINNALITELRNFGCLKCNCKNIPKDFISELGINEHEMIFYNNDVSLSIRIIFEGIKSKFNKNKVYIFAGLGHKWGGGFKLGLKMFISTIIYMVLRFFGVNIVKIGMSLGPFTKSIKILEKMQSKFVNHYYVRDTKSIEFCKKIGIKKAKLCPDLSWLYLSSINKTINKTDFITVNLRESILNENDEKYKEKLIYATERIINVIYKTNNDISIRFLYQVKRDKDFCKRCYDFFKEKYKCEFIDEKITLKNANKYYGDSSINISSRLHSLLLGYKFGALPIAVIDSQKHVKIAQTFIDSKMSELIFDINEKMDKTDIFFKSQLENEYNKLTKIEKSNADKIIKILESIFII